MVVVDDLSIVFLQAVLVWINGMNGGKAITRRTLKMILMWWRWARRSV